MVPKLGVLVRDLSYTQLNFQIISSGNIAAGSAGGVDPVIFYETLSRPCLHMNFAQMQMAEGWGFEGPLVATNVVNASKLLDFPGPSHKAFYVNDLEWTRGFPFRELQPIYSSLPLIARSEDHARLLRELWGGHVIAIFPQFHIQQIHKCLTSTPT